MYRIWFVRLATVATFLTLFVVVLGAYVRLSDAGLGCPDWPGCYGHLGVPQAEEAVEKANQAFPERPVEAHKGWKEMVHRYFAGILGLLVLALAVLSYLNRKDRAQPRVLPLVLLGVIVFQAALGMWTVTLLLKPVIVMLHLMGGLTTLCLLTWLTLRSRAAFENYMPVRGWGKKFALAALCVVAFQAALGGWTSANYAALACPDLPTCQGEWWPETDFADAFVLWRGLGVNYEYGVLDNTSRVTVHLAHRLGAIFTLLFVGFVAIRVWWVNHYASEHDEAMRKASLLVLGVLAGQFLLGLANVFFHLPLAVAAAHNGGAALLLMSLVYLNHRMWPLKR